MSSVPGQSIVQLVPGAPPLVNGVGDCAFAVARALRKTHGVDSIFLVCNPAWSGPETIDGFRVVRLRTRRAPELCEMLFRLSGGQAAAQPVLLQLSPYGFETNGCPIWLLKGLRQWKKADIRAHRLLTFFHELYAMSAPWRRAFWLSPLQRYFAREMAALSDFSMTSMHRFADTLGRWDPARANAVAWLPIPSGIGELESPGRFGDRRAQAVVFGTLGHRSHAYGGSQGALWRMCGMLGIQEVMDIGEGIPEALRGATPVPVRRLGRIEAAQVGRILAASRLGYIDYYAGTLAKSSIFAAYCAHGVCPVLPGPNQSDADGLVAGKHYWWPGAGTLDMASAETVAAQAQNWYAGHDLAAHAGMLAAAMRAA